MVNGIVACRRSDRRNFTMHAKASFLRMLALPCALLVVLLCGACSDSSVSSGGIPCEGQTIDPSLLEIMYWGATSPTNWEPNTGTPTGNLVRPLWYREDAMLIQSVSLRNSEVVRGLFEVSLDPTTGLFSGVSSYEFPFFILMFDHLAGVDELLVTYTSGAYISAVCLAKTVGNALTIVDSLVDTSWLPIGARYINDDEYVIYGRDPATSLAGFYYMSRDTLRGDSLLVAANLLGTDVAGFDVCGSKLYYGVTSNVSGTMQLFEVDLVGGGAPVLLAEFEGAFVSVSLSELNRFAAVSRFAFSRGDGIPGSRIDLVNLDSREVTSVDVRTRPCGFVIADFANWNPSGDSFAFSGAAYTGEGEVFPRRLWVREDVVAP